MNGGLSSRQLPTKVIAHPSFFADLRCPLLEYLRLANGFTRPTSSCSKIDDSVPQPPVGIKEHKGRRVMRNPRIAILTAISEELAAAREFLDFQDRTATDGSVYYHAIFKPEKTKKGGAGAWEVFLPMPAGAGNVSAAALTVRVIKNITPDIVMFVGVAGGITGEVNMYDVIAADKVFHYEPGKIGDTLFARSDNLRGTKQLVERAQAEAQSDSWKRLLAPKIPNERFFARVQPIAAGEKLIKRTASEHTQYILQCSPRAVAVEQEGFGVLMAAREIDTPAIVVRGISDLLDNKTQGALDFVPRNNPHQLKAARHAFAFALSILSNLDVSWIPDITSTGVRKRRVTFTVNTDYANKKKVTDIFEQMFDDDLIDNFTVTKSSVKVSADVESGHAMLIDAARKGGLLESIAGFKIRALDVKPDDRVQAISALYDEILAVRPNVPGWEQRLEGLLQKSELYPSYARLIREIVRQAELSLLKNQPANTETLNNSAINRRLAVSDAKMRVVEDIGRAFQETYTRFKTEFEQATLWMGLLPALPSNEIRNAVDHMAHALTDIGEDNLELAQLSVERGRNHIRLATFDCLRLLLLLHSKALSAAVTRAESDGHDLGKVKERVRRLLEEAKAVTDPPALNRESLDRVMEDGQAIDFLSQELLSVNKRLEEQYESLAEFLGPETLREVIERSR
jgi:nucleoside phosphorylase